MDEVDRERRDLAQLYGPLRRFAAVVGPPEVDPDDLVQEAFVQALRRGPLQDYDRVGAYLRRAIVNLASNQRRSLSRRRRALGRLARAEGEAPHYPSDLAELTRLAPADRAVLYLAEVEGLPYEEIGEALACTTATARARAARARRRLRAALGEED